jgi:hypothetical protein
MFSTFIVAAAVAIEAAACFISLPHHTVTLYCTLPYIHQNQTAYNSLVKPLCFRGDKRFENNSAFADHNTALTEMQHDDFFYLKFAA